MKSAGDRSLVFLLAGVMAVGLAAGFPQAADPTVKLDSYAEWRSGEAVIVDGQRVVVDSKTKWKGKFTSIAAVPLGDEVRVEGTRRGDGAVVARELDVRPNGNALFESDVMTGTNELEGLWLRRGQAFEADEDGDEVLIGELSTRGKRVDRVRHLVNRLAPPYVDRSKIRVYVIDNKEWNAMAMGNGALWIFSGIMDDMTDDELAVVVGHELAHYTHEHSRRQMRRGIWLELGGLAAIAAAEAIDSRGLRAVAQVSSVLGFSAWSNGFGRALEDQADRVGMRYAHEAGFDVRRAPGVWQRFLDKYGDSHKVTNFFFSDHSTAAARRTNLEREIQYNYKSR